MRRVLPGCMYGWIPKVQGALDVHFVSPVPSCLGAACAFHQKDTVSRGEQTVRQSAPRAVKCHIACSAFSHVALKQCCGPRGRKRSDTVGELKLRSDGCDEIDRDFSEPASRHLSDAVIATLPRCNKRQGINGRRGGAPRPALACFSPGRS